MCTRHKNVKKYNLKNKNNTSSWLRRYKVYTTWLRLCHPECVCVRERDWPSGVMFIRPSMPAQVTDSTSGGRYGTALYNLSKLSHKCKEKKQTLNNYWFREVISQLRLHNPLKLSTFFSLHHNEHTDRQWFESYIHAENSPAVPWPNFFIKFSWNVFRKFWAAN